jgi:hypothetical protein
MPTVNIPIKRFSDSRIGEKDRHGSYFHDLVDRHRNFLRATFSPAPPILNHVASCHKDCWAGSVVFKICHFIGEDFPSW